MFLKKLLDTIQSKPNNNCFLIKGKYYTYEELGKAISSIKQNLDLLNLQEVDKNIAVLCTDDFYTYAALFAIWFSGKSYVPLGFQNPIDRNLSILQDSNCKTIISTVELDAVEYGNYKIISPTEQSITNYRLEVPIINENDNAYILFTSGSTGLPKGVPISFKNIDSFTTNFKNSPFKVEETDRCLQMFELTFDVSISSYLPALLVGATIYTVPNDGIKYINVLKLLQDHKLTSIQIVPSVLKLGKSFLSRMSFPELKNCILTGEATQFDLFLDLKKVAPNANIFNYYGPTEATIYCSYYECTGNNVKTYNGMLAIGEKLGNMELLIVGSENEELPVNKKGELLISGSQLILGYLNNSEKNQQSFIVKNVEGINRIFYRSGDLCYKDEDGTIFYCGRLDNQIKLQGFRVELSEIEMVVRKELNLNNVVIPIENKFGVTDLYIAIEETNKKIKEKVLGKLNSKLPSYMIPKTVFLIETFPLGTSGKIDKLRIKTMIEDELGSN